MEAFVILILKCLLLGVIWAALLIPTFCNKNSLFRYAVTIIVIAAVCYVFRGWAGIINRMTVIALVTLVVAWITSMLAFEKDSKNKSKVISFCCVISAFSYLISNWVEFSIL